MGGGDCAAAMHHVDPLRQHSDSKFILSLVDVRELIDGVRGIQGRVILIGEVSLEERPDPCDDGLDPIVTEGFLNPFADRLSLGADQYYTFRGEMH